MDKIIDKLDTVPGMILAEIIIIGIIILTTWSSDIIFIYKWKLCHTSYSLKRW